MTAPIIEAMAEEAYKAYMAGLIGCCEPTWGQLLQDHRDRLISAQTAAYYTGLSEYERKWGTEREKLVGSISHATTRLHEMIDGGEECSGRDSQICTIINILSNHPYRESVSNYIKIIDEQNEEINSLHSKNQEIDALRAANGELVDALRPFAECDAIDIKIGDPTRQWLWIPSCTNQDAAKGISFQHIADARKTLKKHTKESDHDAV